LNIDAGSRARSIQKINYKKNERKNQRAKLIVTETKPLHGKVRISGAKNSVLPIIAASILGDSESVIEEVPDLTDVKIMCELLESFGVDVNFLSDKSKLFINTRDILNTTAPYELVNKMRASILVMGPLLARTE